MGDQLLSIQLWLNNSSLLLQLLHHISEIRSFNRLGFLHRLADIKVLGFNRIILNLEGIIKLALDSYTTFLLLSQLTVMVGEVLLLILLPINLGMIDNGPLTGRGHGLLLLQPISEIFYQYSMPFSCFRLQGWQLTLQCHGGLVVGSLTTEGSCLLSYVSSVSILCKLRSEELT